MLKKTQFIFNKILKIKKSNQIKINLFFKVLVIQIINLLIFISKKRNKLDINSCKDKLLKLNQYNLKE